MTTTAEIEDIAAEFANEIDGAIERALAEGDGSKEAYAAIAAVLARKAAEFTIEANESASSA
jgi:hypothetical protein